MGQTGGRKFMFIFIRSSYLSVLDNSISSHKTWSHCYDSVITLREVIAAYFAVLAEIEGQIACITNR